MKKDSGLCRAEQLYESAKSGCGYRSLYQCVMKRIIDIAICTAIFPLILVVGVPIALAIKLEDGGPIFYHSRRIGKDFREFDMLKFRSMEINAPDWRNSDGSTYNSRTDQRVTRIGRVIRETSMDELPQCLNVIRGEMSLIGPRAGDAESRDTYEEDEKDKLLVRPGIGGYTQAYYRNRIGVREKRLYDAWYAHNVSFGLDVKIFLRTAAAVLKRENIYTNEAD